MIDYYKKVVFENYANFNGRARRSEYWYFYLMNILISTGISVVVEILKLATGSNALGFLSIVYSLAVFLPSMAVSVRRLHDVGKSGWLLLAAFVVTCISVAVIAVGVMVSFKPTTIPINFTWIGVAGFIFLATAIYMLVLHCKNSEEGNNEYGPNPKQVENELDLLGTE